MSIDIRFQRQLNLKEIEEKTNIRIKENKGIKFLSYNGSCLPIIDLDENGYFKSICQYGLNTLNKIMPIIVSTFKVKFITDNELQFILYEQMRGNEVDIDKLFDETTKKYGHDIE
ncbi:MAG: hypothetical protein U9Q27_02000 [Patescibacteria group bacterium]|nr:hypothetical protein [Patescibacteria group bacterium]